jgi:SMI1/KNR4 family protein SUKH-1
MDAMEEWVKRVHEKLEAERLASDAPSRLFTPARPEQVEALEQELGCPLPRSYRRFLEVSDGWTGFWFGLTLTGAGSLAREGLETQLLEALEEGLVEAEDLAWAVILGANVDEDLYLLFDPAEAGPGEEPPIQMYSAGDGLLESFDSFARLMETLASGDLLPRTVPLDLERQFRPWTAQGPLHEGPLAEEDGVDGCRPEA